LGWVAARTVRFDFSGAAAALPVPHMGWNTVTPRGRDGLFRDLPAEPAFYFVHSYHVVCEHDADVAATAHYGYEFVCALQRQNIYGTQFHPEKSHRYGLQLLRNFVHGD
jgi:glutamine amidotransferase